MEKTRRSGKEVETTWHVATPFEEVWILASDLRMDGVPTSWRQPARSPWSASARADTDLDKTDNGRTPSRPGRPRAARIDPPVIRPGFLGTQPLPALAFEQHRPRCLRREHYAEAAAERS
jgi:hypothetical protein